MLWVDECDELAPEMATIDTKNAPISILITCVSYAKNRATGATLDPNKQVRGTLGNALMSVQKTGAMAI